MRKPYEIRKYILRLDQNMMKWGNMIGKVMKSMEHGVYRDAESAINSLFKVTELAQNTQNGQRKKRAQNQQTIENTGFSARI